MQEKLMAALEEREWTDQFGQHWEATGRDRHGRIYRINHTKAASGWPDREAARTQMRQAIAAGDAQK